MLDKYLHDIIEKLILIINDEKYKNDIYNNILIPFNKIIIDKLFPYLIILFVLFIILLILLIIILYILLSK